MAALGWSVERLWTAVSDTDLLFHPQGNPWHEIHGPIRKLLVRYWYPDADPRRQAHSEACEFVRFLAAESLGRDQAVLLVECLWHGAHSFDGDWVEAEARLVPLARELSDGLSASRTFSPQALRGSAAEIMANDVELADALSGSEGLLRRLMDTVRSP
jgi:hypothetical protein